MTAEEALKILKNRYLATTEEDRQADALAVDALEKQIPKEPTDFVWRTVAGQIRLCPTCRNTVSRVGRYCQNCGQRVRV